MAKIMYCTNREDFIGELTGFRRSNYIGLNFSLCDPYGEQWNIYKEKTALIVRSHTLTVEFMREEDVQRLANGEDEAEGEEENATVEGLSGTKYDREDLEGVDISELIKPINEDDFMHAPYYGPTFNPGKVKERRKTFLYAEIKRLNRKVGEYSHELFNLNKEQSE